MKKSVILIIAVVYFASILIVGLLGLQMRVDTVVYVDSLVYTPQGVIDEEKSKTDYDYFIKTADGGYYREIVYKNTKLNGDGTPQYSAGDVYIKETFAKGIEITVTFDVRPDNADNKNLLVAFNEDALYRINGEVVTDKNQAVKEDDEVTGSVIVKQGNHQSVTVIFMKGENFKFSVSPADGNKKNVKIQVTINCEDRQT